MSTSRFVSRRALALAVAAAAFAVPSLSSAGNVNVEINLTSGVTILYYHSSLHVDLDAASLLVPSACTGSTATGSYECADGGIKTVTATTTGGTAIATYTAPAAPSGSVDPTAVPLVLQNVWALRAMGGSSANTTVTTTLGTGTTLSNGTSTIVLTGIDVGSGTAGTPSFGATTDAVTVADPGLGTPLQGFVALRLDLSNALLTGLYKNTATQYTITVTST